MSEKRDLKADLKYWKSLEWDGYNDINERIDFACTVLPYAIEQAIALKTENAKLRATLDEIAHPMKYLQKEAEENGCTLNGLAYAVCNDANYIKGIADKALQALESEEKK